MTERLTAQRSAPRRGGALAGPGGWPFDYGADAHQRGRALPRPVNCRLVRIPPPEGAAGTVRQHSRPPAAAAG